MRLAKQMPAHLVPSSKSRRGPYNSRSRSPRPVLVTLWPLFAVLATFVLTVVYFVAIRRHKVELSFKQLSAFERQVQTLGNHTAYMVELPGRDEFVTAFAPDEWAKLSSRIEYVVFVYDDMYAVVGDAVRWFSEVVDAFAKMPVPRYGVVLYSCGCIIPNEVFTRTATRFDAFECMMLPGFVVPKESVAFLNVSIPDGRCRHREEVLSQNWYSNNAWKLPNARQEHVALRIALSSHATT